jgi:hypothetical protein
MAPDSHKAEFKLSITRALSDQLAVALADLTAAPLTRAAIDALDARPGVYQLYLHDDLVYVGKASGSLRQRLTRHYQRVSARRNIQPSDLKFICLYVDEDLDASAPEKLLIKRYKEDSASPWNSNGFGANDPGRERDTTGLKANHFFVRYPIDLDYMINVSPTQSLPLKDGIGFLRSSLPFLLRVDRKYAKITAPIVTFNIGMTVRSLIEVVLAAMPDGWQVTAFRGYLIMYQENRDYRSATDFWRTTDGAVVHSSGKAELRKPGKISEGLD